MVADTITRLNNNLVNENPGQKIDLSTDEDVLTVHYRGLGSDALTSVTGFYSYRYLLDLDAAGTPTDQANASQPQRYDPARWRLGPTQHRAPKPNWIGTDRFRGASCWQSHPGMLRGCVPYWNPKPA